MATAPMKTKRHLPKTAPLKKPPFAASEKTVLLAVTGMSPAVLTETVWTLAHGAEPVIPDKVVAVTTRAGKKKLQEELLSPRPDYSGHTVWMALSASLHKKGHNTENKLQFGDTNEHIRVFTRNTPTGPAELDTVTTDEENMAAADFLLDCVRAIVSTENTRLVASIAGGYKTMSALLYACVSLIGHDGDRITHVLVQDPFDKQLSPGFYYPAQPAKILDFKGRKIRASDAVISLADVPFVPFRKLFSENFDAHPRSFTELVDFCKESVDSIAAKDIRLKFDRLARTLAVNGEPLRLSPSECMVIDFFIHSLKNKAVFSGYKSAVDNLKTFAAAQMAEQKKKNLVLQEWKCPKDDGECCHLITRSISDIKKKLTTPTLKPLARILPQKGRCSLDIDPAKVKVEGWNGS